METGDSENDTYVCDFGGQEVLNIGKASQGLKNKISRFENFPYWRGGRMGGLLGV